MAKLKAFWGELPHQAQAAITSFGAAFLAAFVHAVSDSECFTLLCLKHYAATGISAGLVTLRVFYMLPSNGKPTQGQGEVPK